MITGKRTAGNSPANVAADHKRVSRVTLPERSRVAKASVFLDGFGGVDPQAVRAVVYRRLGDAERAGWTNLSTNPNAAVNLSGGWNRWFLTGDPARSTTQWAVGSTSVSVVTNAFGSAAPRIAGLQVAWTPTAGKVYSASIWVRVPRAGTWMVRFQDGNTSHAEYSDQSPGGVGGVTTTGAGWVLFTWTAMTAWTLLPLGSPAVVTLEPATGTSDFGSETLYFGGLLVVEGSVLPDYFDGDSPGCAWTGTAGLSTSTSPGYVNRVTNPNAVGAVSPWFLGGSGGGSLALSTARARAGPSSLLLTKGTTFSYAEFNVTILPGAPHRWSVWVWPSATGTVNLICRAPFLFHSFTGVPANQWTRLSWLFYPQHPEAPDTNVRTFDVGWEAADAATGTQLWIDQAMIVTTPDDPDYFDGGSPGARWAGAPDASVSVTIDSPLIASSDERVVDVGDDGAWVDFPFPDTVDEDLDAGDYWIGVHAGGGSALRVFGDAPTTIQSKAGADAYADGPSDPFGRPDAQTADLSAFLTFFPGWSFPDETDFHYGRYAFELAQRAFQGSPVQGSRVSAKAGWYGAIFDPEMGSFCIAREDGPLAEFVGERLRISSLSEGPAGRRSVVCYCHQMGQVAEDVALSRRAWLALSTLQIDQLDVLVEVIA